jgi:VCBS repeat protein
MPGRLRLARFVAAAALLAPAIGRAQIDFEGARRLPYPAGFDSVAVGDFDEDGSPDLAYPGATFARSGCDRSFQTDVVFAFRESRGVAVGDLDGDGHADVVTLNPRTARVHVFRGNGAFAFPVGFNYPAGSDPARVAIARLKPQHPDVVVLNPPSNSVSILLGAGGGMLLPATSYSVGTTPVALSIGDFDEDGTDDVVTANAGSHDLTISFGDGAGGIRLARAQAIAGCTPTAMDVADFDGDGHLDVAVATTVCALDGNDVSILFGDGTGAFPAEGRLASGVANDRLLAADLDRDGREDLIVLEDSTAGHVAIHYGRGDRTFEPPRFLVIPTSVGPIAAADFDRDGLVDLALGPIVVFASGRRTYETAPVFFIGVGADGIASGDFDGDGHLDVAAANSVSSDIAVLLGDGAGSFAPAVRTFAGGQLIAVAAADVDRDGDLDLVACARATGDVVTFLGAGDGTFSAGPRTAIGANLSAIHVRDLDGDGFPDVLAARDVPAAFVRQLRGDGMGGFAAVADYAIIGRAYDIATADLDGDGATDMIVADASRVGILRGDGAGGFLPAVHTVLGSVILSVLPVDLDADGDLDVLVGRPPFTPAVLMVGDGTGAFAPIELPSITDAVFATADVDGDGVSDLVAGGNVAYRGLGAGAFAAPSLALEGDPSRFVLGDFDEDGLVDVASVTGLRYVQLLRNRSSACAAGTVDRAAGAPSAALTVNGSTGDTQRIVRASRGAALTIAIAAAASGPSPGRYVLWAWPGCAANPVMLSLHGQPVGCVVDPTPLQRLLRPQPIRCARGAGVPSIACRGVDEVAGAPAAAPFSIALAHGFASPIRLTLQGVLADASSPAGFSVTNVVHVDVH